MDWGFFMSAGKSNKAQVLFFAVIILRLVKLMGALSTGYIDGLSHQQIKISRNH